MKQFLAYILYKKDIIRDDERTNFSLIFLGKGSSKNEIKMNILKQHLLCFFICLFAILGCKQHPEEEIRQVDTNEFLALLDTVSIPIVGDQMGAYGGWYLSDDNYLVSSNYQLHRIDVFDFKQRRFSHSIQLDHDGPNAVGRFGNAIKVGDDYIVISGSARYCRVSKEGLVVSRLSQQSNMNFAKEGYTWAHSKPTTGNYFEICFDKETNTLYKPSYKFGDDGTMDFSSHFMASISLDSFAIHTVKINYPQKVVASYPKTGFLGNGSMVRNGSLLVFNFPGGNEIYTFDTIKKVMEVHNPEITNKNEMKINVSDYGNDLRDAIFKGQMKSPRYLGIKYNATSNTYYRLHKTKARNKSMFDVDFFLLKMDADFKTLAQYNLGSLFNPTFQIHKGYLYFSASEPDKSALYFFKLYRIKG